MAANKTSSSANFKALITEMINVDKPYALPTSIRVIGRQVPVRIREDHDAFGKDGEFDYVSCSISVRTGLLPMEEADTALHETIHAIDHWLALGLTERQVRLLATALIGLFQDNPEYAEYLTRPMSDNE